MIAKIKLAEMSNQRANENALIITKKAIPLWQISDYSRKYRQGDLAKR